LTAERKPRKVNVFGVRPQLPWGTWGAAENDFEWFVFAEWPELGRLKSELIQAGAEIASLTGSGSAVYALFDSAQKLADALKWVPAGWQAYRTRTLSRAEYLRGVYNQLT
jgi:4-diphosphocytidyl-2C-methyl-D-erythritol kinase